MDSIKTKIVNASQSTKHDNVTYSDLSATGTYTRALYVPMGARLDTIHLKSATQFAGGSTVMTIKVGYPVGVSQSDSSSAIAAADLIAAFDWDAETPGSVVVDKNLIDGKMVLPPMNKSSAAVANSNIEEYSSSGEYVVPVIATIVVGTGAPTSGSMYWWVDYRFDANIVWAQTTLS